MVNPTTWQTRNLDIPGLEFHHLRCFGVNIAFDPLKSPHYKVICVRDSVLSSKSVPYRQIEIYSSETYSWRPSGEAFTAPVGVDFNMIWFPGGVFWNGAINWISCNGGDSLYFNVEQESIHTLPMPRPISRRVRYFGESSNHLHHVACDNMPWIVAEYRIYEMERDYSGWFVKYIVTVSDVRDAFLEMGLDSKSLFSILCILRRGNGDEEESLLVVQLNVNGTVIWYNLTGKPFKKVLDFAPTTSSADANCNESSRTNRFEWYNAYQYIESAASV